MSEPNASLLKTVARIEELIAKSGRRLAEVLDTKRLALASGLTEPEVELLLAGGMPEEEDPDDMVRNRVRFLYESHTGPNGGPRDIRDIAAAIDQTTVWTRKLADGKAKPSLWTGSQLTKYYKVAATFLTDAPADALNRELQRNLFDLEVEADPAKALRDMGVVHMSGRSPLMTKPDLAALARMVAELQFDFDRVRRVVDHLANHPEADQ
ncbi:hypothetical protein [Streptomyces pseudovenezuelae]|uniref:Uncharacterized protein (DUF302 family) n=1 Tax=Streptomyces pseudovenezuelae TaxID=67350 RepID=A0ABT6LRM3_9ACTN|nr:hypothetical protein [Streptomyces pseudovenezuelae]MDH6218024.1 uncharacterized protein (DUF302 family) [Streptomyces pseudovenezuelae]